MAVVDLELFKQHVRADDFADDDNYMQHLLDTAEEAVISATHRTDYELRLLGNGEYPKRLKHAIMMVAAHWYNQRESVAGTQMHEVPDALQALIKPLRKLAE
jgi:uncharacterized phage protein (predicted DNA packaging)